MPVILSRYDYARRLGEEPDPHDLMRPFPAGFRVKSGKPQNEHITSAFAPESGQGDTISLIHRRRAACNRTVLIVPQISGVVSSKGIRIPAARKHIPKLEQVAGFRARQWLR
jgi:hypothetical protein